VNDLEVQEIFEGIRLHLTSNYDFKKYNGKIKRKNFPKIYLGRLMKEIQTRNQMIFYFLWNQIEFEKRDGRYSAFIGDFLSDECMKNYKRFVGLAKNFDYHIESEFGRFLTFHKLSDLKDSNVILEQYYTDKFNFLTLMCIYKFTKIKDYWETDKRPLMGELLRKLENAEIFFNFPKQRFVEAFTKSINKS